MLARGSFDAHDLFGAPDRSWLDLDSRVNVQPDPAAPWDAALNIDLAADASLTTGMRKFQRVFTKGAPMSIRANIGASAEARVDVYVQIRADGQGLSDALANGRKLSIGTLEVGADGPAVLDLDFDAPRTRARSLRVLMDIHAGNDDVNVEIDDLQWIEWKTPFVPTGE